MRHFHCRHALVFPDQSDALNCTTAFVVPDRHPAQTTALWKPAAWKMRIDGPSRAKWCPHYESENGLPLNGTTRALHRENGRGAAYAAAALLRQQRQQTGSQRVGGEGVAAATTSPGVAASRKERLAERPN